MTHPQSPSPPPTTTGRIPTICVGLIAAVLMVGTTPQAATADPYLATVVLTAKSDVSQSQVTSVMNVMSALNGDDPAVGISAVFADSSTADAALQQVESSTSSTSCTRADTLVTCTFTTPKGYSTVSSLVSRIYNANGRVVTLTVQVTNIPLARISVDEINAGKLSGFARADAKNPLTDNTIVFAIAEGATSSVLDSTFGSLTTEAVVYTALSAEFDTTSMATSAQQSYSAYLTFTQSGSTISAVADSPTFSFATYMYAAVGYVPSIGGRVTTLSVSVGSTADAMVLTATANSGAMGGVSSAKMTINNGNDDDDVPVGAIVGGVLGGLTLIAIVVVGGFLFWKFKMSKSAQVEDEQVGNPDTKAANTEEAV